ncbi:unnamed protein product [Alopecurus aequalis]
MADAQEEEEEASRTKGEQNWMDAYDRRSAEEYWYPHKTESDQEVADAGNYHAHRLWKTDEITTTPPMCYTDNPGRFTHSRDTLQICCIKIASIRRGLRWPLDVFGMVTARDVLEIQRKHNIIFARARSNCQTIMEEHPYLDLTGPSRAVVTCFDPGNIEVVLKVRGASETEDRDLSFLVLELKERRYCHYDPEYTSKCSTLELTLCHVEKAVEATISVRLIGGSSWPDGFQGVLTASIASINDAEVSLLAFGVDKMPLVTDDGMIKLSRRVVSVERLDGELKVSIAARSENDERGAKVDDVVFTPKDCGRSCGVLNFGACKMQVTVAWSLFGF